MGIRSVMHSSDGLSGVERLTADAPSRRPGFRGLRLLSSPVPLDCYELRAVIAEGAAAVVYLGTDRTLQVPVAIREYMPPGLAWRHATSRVVPLSPAQEMPFARGLQAFIDEARTLARCDHPSLLRIVRLLEANGTAYSVMPHYVGRRLTDVRPDPTAPDHEQRLRALLSDLLGALEAFHAFGSVHGGVSPDNILLLQNGRPVLLRPRALSPETGEPVDTLAGYMNDRSPSISVPGGSPTGPWTDVRDAARVIRFLTSLTGPQPRYSRSFLAALDAAESPLPDRRPRSVAEFREWLTEAPPSEPASAGARRQESPAPTEDMSSRESEEGTTLAVAPAAMTPDLLLPLGEEAPEATPVADPAPTAERDTAAAPPAAVPPSTPVMPERAERDAPQESVDRHVAAIAKSQDRRTRSTAWKTAALVAILAVPAIATWFLTRPPVAVQGWSPALAPPSLTPSRDAPNAVATADPTSADAASQAASGAIGNGGAATEPSPGGARSATPATGDLAADRAPLTTSTAPPPPMTAPENAALPQRSGETAELPTRVAPQRPPSQATAPAVPPSPPPKQGSPREACAPRTQFALYRCMQTQCSQPRWSNHAECIRLRATDDVQ